MLKIIKTNKVELLISTLLIFVTLSLRLPGLGYSHFYGDETKTFYLLKTTTATEFLLNQRKGPIQFLVVWFMEKLIGGFNEFYTRLPFVLAGTLSVFVFYFIVRKLFGYKIAAIASFLFSLNGFFIAFSRTIQYQSFLTLFGFLAFLSILYFEETKKNYYLLFSSVFLALAFLSHYDGIYFAVPVIFIAAKFLHEHKGEYKRFLVVFLLPLLIITGVFYFPYFLKGYAGKYTFGYISKRISGVGYNPNNSLYTANVYNPLLVGFIPIVFAVFGFVGGGIDFKKSLILVWFLVPFVIFEFIFSNPGTHINNYYIPLFILSAQGILYVYNVIKKGFVKKAFVLFLFLVFLSTFVIDVFVYIPALNQGYPWKKSKLAFFNVRVPNKNYHLYMYGFPYYRAWDQIKDYMYLKKGVRNFYTNDNAVMAKYYLTKYDLSVPGSNFVPQYYINIINSQEYVSLDQKFFDANKYVLEREFFKNGTIVAQIYRLAY